MNWYMAVLTKYAVFSGRARRKEYWVFVLFNTLILLGLEFVGGGNWNLLLICYLVGVLLPSIGVMVRRLHDTGLSGWWQLIALTPFIGGLVLLFLLVRDSEPGENQYGPNPKEAAAIA